MQTTETFGETKLEKAVFFSLIFFMYLFLFWTLLISHQIVYLVLFVILAASNLLILGSGKFELSEFSRITHSAARSFRLRLEKTRISTILTIAFTLRFLWGFAYEVGPTGDFKYFYQFTVRLLTGHMSALGNTKSPVTVLYYWGILKLFDNSLFFVYLINALMGCLQIWLAYKISRMLFRSEASAKLTAILISIFPSISIFSCVTSSEMPFATIMLVLLFVCSRFIIEEELPSNRNIFFHGAILGALTAILHLTRNIGVLIGVWLLISLLLFKKFDLRKKIILGAVYLIALFAFLLPQIKYNYNRYGVFSIQSSMFSSINFLIGTNQEKGGIYNTEDVQLVKSKYPITGKTYKEASKYARQLAIERIKKDPSGFVAFVLTRKFHNMWGEDYYGVHSGVSRSKQAAEIRKEQERYKRSRLKARADKEARRQLAVPYKIRPSTRFWAKLSNGYYFLMLFILLCSLYPIMGLRFSPQSRIFLMLAGIIFITVFLHLIIEVKSRYHFHCLFLFCILSGGVIHNKLSSPRTRFR